MVASSDATAKAGPLDKVREFRRDMAPTQWLQTKLMFASIILLHVIGFGVFIVFVLPGHYKGWASVFLCSRTRWGCATPSTQTTSRRSTTPHAS